LLVVSSGARRRGRRQGSDSKSHIELLRTKSALNKKR
jgi:hypothetical protein